MPHLKQELNLHLIFEIATYKSRAELVPFIKHLYKIDYFTGMFEPIIYLSDFWVLNRDLISLDEDSLDRMTRVRNGEHQSESPTINAADLTEKDIENLNNKGAVHLTWDNYSLHYFSFHESFKEQIRQQEEFGLMSADMFDEYKRIWLETDPILFTVTAIVSCLHTVFEFLAMKNEIQFWNGKEDVEGLSVKTLYINIAMQIVITLYLFDNETSMMVFVP